MNINKIQTDSRKIVNGDTFIAIQGISSDGHDYINTAINSGASKVIASKHGDYINNDIIEYVDDTLVYLKNLLKDNYSEKINSMNLIGVTGTNGKTTTCYLIYQLLNNLGCKTAYIGTIGLYYLDEFKELNNTTPELLELYKILMTIYDNGINYVVMEVSSHALEQDRIYGLDLKIGAFTNLTQDHLDYHLNMENYLNAKLKIFNHLSGPIIVNNDVDYSEYFLKNEFYTIGNNSDYQIIDIKYDINKTNIKFKYNNENYEVTTNLISDFNVTNYLMALAIINKLGFEIKDIINVTKDVYAPKGRVESITVKNGVAIVDYAHTPDAVEKIIKSFSLNKKGKVITVIGCGGDRDPKKRPIMGNISTTQSDYVILTSDNPRTEDPNMIINDIKSGIKSNNYEIIEDRRKAIYTALDLIKDEDIVLILGKGHEEYQEINKVKHHFSDKEVVNDYLKN